MFDTEYISKIETKELPPREFMEVSGNASWVSYTTEPNDGWLTVEEGTRYGRRKAKFSAARRRNKFSKNMDGHSRGFERSKAALHL